MLTDERLREIEQYDDTQCHEPGPQCAEYIRMLLGEVKRLRQGIDDAFDRANNRWCEWGERAEAVLEILEKARGTWIDTEESHAD